MGCRMLAIIEQESEAAPDILDQVPKWFEDWEQTLSRFRADSELSRLNRTVDQYVPVSQVLWDVFQASLAANRATRGLVSPTVLDALHRAGYDRPFEEITANKETTNSWIDIQPLSLVLYDEESRSICLPPGIHLDFGGIAKGWAAQQAVERLMKSGPTIMNAGGDISLSGPCLCEEPWPIGISNPFQPDQDLAILHLSGGGIATSGKDRRRWKQGDLLQHHIIDPRTGRPAVTDILAATVVAPTTIEAEAAAKSVFLLGSGAGLEWLESDSALAGLLVLDDGQVLTSSRMEEYVAEYL
jgi:thiamine biosynthesis lipoprotein